MSNATAVETVDERKARIAAMKLNENNELDGVYEYEYRGSGYWSTKSYAVVRGSYYSCGYGTPEAAAASRLVNIALWPCEVAKIELGKWKKVLVPPPEMGDI